MPNKVLSRRWVCWQCQLLLHSLVYWHRLHQVMYMWWPDTLRRRKSKTMVTLAALYTGNRWSTVYCNVNTIGVWSMSWKKKDIYVLSHYVAAREVEKRRFDLSNYRPPPLLPEDVLFYVRFFIQNKIQKVWHVILTIKTIYTRVLICRP